MNMWTSKEWRRACCAAAILVAGCKTSPGPGSEAKTPERWSTKNQSVLSRDPALLRLPVEMPSDPEAYEALRAAAIDLLGQAFESPNPLLRANAIESMHPAPEAIDPLVRAALADENRGVRFVAAMTIGKLRKRNLAYLVEPMLDDPSDSVRAAAIFALRRCDLSVDLTPLALMVRSKDPEIRANAAVVLGMLGDPSALPMLREAVRVRSVRMPLARSRVVDLQIAEAMVRLGADRELEVIRAALFAPEDQAEMVVLACLMCGRLNDVAYAAPLLDIAMRTGREQEAPEVRLAAVQGLAQIDPARAPAPLAVPFLAHDRYDVRQQAAITLGWVGDRAYLPNLSALLNDPNALVQVAAAGAILRVLA